MQDPFPYFERFPDADILTSSDEVVNSVDDDKLEQWDRCKLSLSLSPFFWNSPMDVYFYFYQS